MPIEIRLAVTVRRPRPEVAQVLFDPSFDTEWIAGLTAATVTPLGLLRAGSTVVRRFADRRREVVDEQTVVEAEDGRILVVQRSRPFPQILGFELERTPEGTLLRVHLVGVVPGLRRVLSPWLRWRLRRALLQDLWALKDFVEARSEAAAVMARLPADD